MNRDETRKATEVMLAYADGKTIQWRLRASNHAWSETLGADDNSPSWNWFHSEYRIKPEPREWWIRVGRANVSCTRLGADVVDCDEALEPDGSKWVRVREVMEND